MTKFNDGKTRQNDDNGQNQDISKHYLFLEKQEVWQEEQGGRRHNKGV